MDQFNKKVLCIAVATSFAIAPVTTTMAADVGNFFNADSDSKVKVGIFYNNSKRDVEQEGAATLYSEATVETSTTEGGATQTETNVIGASLTGLSAEEQNEDLFAKISYAVTPKIELYAKLGVTRSELEDIDGQLSEGSSFNITEGGDNPLNLTESTSFVESANGGLQGGEGDLGVMVGIGGKLTLAEFENGWRLGLDAQYVRRDSDMDEPLFADPDATEVSWEVTDRTSEELQGSVLLGQTRGAFRPYGGISYSKMESEYDLKFTGDPAILPDTFVLSSGELEFENEDNLGFFAGFDYELSNMTISFEAKAGDEEGVTLGLNKEL